MAEEAKPAEGSEEAPAAKSGGMNTFVLIFFLVDLLVVGGGAFVVFKSTMGHETPKMEEELGITALIEERESRERSPVLYTMKKFNVNLTGLPNRKLRVEMHLEMLDEEGFEEIFTSKSEARDAVVRLLSEKVFSEIESIQGKLFLKDQVATSLNKYLKKGVVKDVYFSEFLVQ